MLDSNIHRLLRRQIQNAGFEEADVLKFKDFLRAVNDAYNSFDGDVKHIELILEESSNELYKLNQILKSKVDNVENEINTIVNTIEGVIFKTDLKGDFLYLNQAWEDMTHIPVDISLGKNYREFLYDKNHDIADTINDVLRGKNKEFKTLFKYHRMNGDEFWVQLKLDFIKDADGEISGTIGTMVDVTQLKQTEIKLNKANKIKDEFLSTMSHEIRTPLNAVIGMSDILLMDKFLPEQSENLQILKYSSEHLLALINDLLDLNKFKSKEMKLIINDFNLTEFVQNIELKYKQTVLRKNLDFKTILDDNLPPVIRGDSLKLAQVLENLLSNAFKFTDQGAVTFKIEKLESNQNSTKVRFTVSDTGIGVSYDKQKDIFKSFVQANDDTSKIYGGTGLGLYISKQLLKLQKSHLELESEKGKGSTFWFDMTFDHSQIKTKVSPKKVSKTEAIDLKLLVAEDNKLNILLLEKLFKKWNINYKIAHNGKELLNIYKKEDFDLILMDLQMPVLDGYDTTRYIRKMEDSSKALIPIVALTAFSRSEVQDKIDRHKMDGYISKPFDVNVLHDLLKFYSNKKTQIA